MSDDRRHAITIIALVGSVFSPFYAEARRAGAASPLSHCSMNVALYGPTQDRWAFTERGAASLARGEDTLAIGPSEMRWEGDALVVDFDELTAPFGSRLAGQIRIHPEAWYGRPLPLDAASRHRWWPLAPAARAEVVLTHPSLRWRGEAYLDANGGDEPLEAAFRGWTWARVAAGRRSIVTYDVTRRDGSQLLLARAFDHGGRVTDDVAVAGARVRPTLWGLRRTVHASPGERPEVLKTLEDTPFYARSLVRAGFFGARAVGTHETLSLDRWRNPVVQRMLPYRMRRA